MHRLPSPMETLLKKDATFYLNEECQQSIDVLKEKMVTVTILVFPDWKKEFHVHVDASCIALQAVMTQASEGELDHPIAFAREEPTNLEEGLLDAQVFAMHIADNQFADIIHFMITETTPKGYTSQQKKELVVCPKNFFVIVGHLCQMGSDEFLRCYVPKFEWNNILAEAHGGLIQPPGKKMGARYIITVTKYLTRWAKAQPVKDCIGVATTKFLFEYVLTRFVFPKILMSDRVTHFLNETINVLMEEFQVYHQNSTPYHPQANGTVEAFNNILDNMLMKVCNAQRNDWDVRAPTVLWAYRTTCKN
eukprot:PITA_15912